MCVWRVRSGRLVGATPSDVYQEITQRNKRNIIYGDTAGALTARHDDELYPALRVIVQWEPVAPRKIDEIRRDRDSTAGMENGNYLARIVALVLLDRSNNLPAY